MWVCQLGKSFTVLLELVRMQTYMCTLKTSRLHGNKQLPTIDRANLTLELSVKSKSVFQVLSLWQRLSKWTKWTLLFPHVLSQMSCSRKWQVTLITWACSPSYFWYEHAPYPTQLLTKAAWSAVSSLTPMAWQLNWANASTELIFMRMRMIFTLASAYADARVKIIALSR